MPKISVIVPVYKVEDCLPRCLDSILQQSFEDFELILIDDGSPDRSGNICDEYAKKDGRIRVIHQENQGVSLTRNHGMQNANGDFLTFVDSDDYVAKDFLLLLYRSITSFDTDLAICNLVLVGPQLTIFDHGYKKGEVLDRNGIRNIFFKHIENNDNTNGYFSLCNKIFKRNIILNNNLSLNPKMSFGEDMTFALQYIEKCHSISFESEALYYYDIGESGLHEQSDLKFLDDALACFKEQQRILNFHEANESNMKLYGKYFYFIMKCLASAEKNGKDAFANVKKILQRENVVAFCAQIDNFKDGKNRPSNVGRMIHLIATKHPGMAASFYLLARKLKKIS